MPPNMTNMVNNNINNFNPNMIIPNMPNMLNNINNEEEEWIKGFKMAVDEINNNYVPDEIEENHGPKITIIFVTTQGVSHSLFATHGTTVDELIKKYLKRAGRLDLYETKSKKICFSFNNIVLKYGDKTPVEQLFKDKPYPKVVFNDVNNLCG